MSRLTLGEFVMGTTVTIEDVELDSGSVYCDRAYDIVEIMSNSGITLDDVIHEAVSSGWESPELDFDAIADWIPAGHATDTQLSDLAYRIARELVSRLDNVRQCADRYLETNRQNVERIRELERAAVPDAATA
jgi:hypothetical protein